MEGMVIRDPYCMEFHEGSDRDPCCSESMRAMIRGAYCRDSKKGVIIRDPYSRHSMEE